MTDARKPLFETRTNAVRAITVRTKAVRTIAVLICILLTLTGIASVASAEETGSSEKEEFLHIWIGGVLLTSRNARDPFGDGTVSYDADTYTLTLNNYNYSGEGYVYDTSEGEKIGGIIFLDEAESYTIRLEGENTLTHICGEDVHYSGALYAYSNVTITGSGTLTAKSGKAVKSSYAIYCEGELVINRATVVAESDDASSYSCGIYCDLGVTVNEGTVKAKGAKSEHVSAGISCKDVTFSGGELEAEGGEGVTYSDGISCFGDFVMTGGNLNLLAGPSNFSSGLYVDGKKATFSGGNAVISGGPDGTGVNKYTEEGADPVTIGIGRVRSLIISGGNMAVNGILDNEIDGRGYELTEGGEETIIEPKAGQLTGTYKRLEFPAEPGKANLTWLFILIPAVLLISAGIAVAVIILKRKQKNNNGEACQQ